MSILKLPNNEQELAQFQKDVDVMVNCFNEYKKEVERLEKLLNDSILVNERINTANVHLVESLKNINMILNANNELFIGNSQVENMMKELSKFIVSSESIKAGVINAKL